MCDQDDAYDSEVLDNPPLYPIVITWDDEGDVVIDTGSLDDYYVWAVLQHAAETIKTRIATPRIRRGSDE